MPLAYQGAANRKFSYKSTGKCGEQTFRATRSRSQTKKNRCQRTLKFFCCPRRPSPSRRSRSTSVSRTLSSTPSIHLLDLPSPLLRPIRVTDSRWTHVALTSVKLLLAPTDDVDADDGDDVIRAVTAAEVRELTAQVDAALQDQQLSLTSLNATIHRGVPALWLRERASYTSFLKNFTRRSAPLLLLSSSGRHTLGYVAQVNDFRQPIPIVDGDSEHALPICTFTWSPTRCAYEHPTWSVDGPLSGVADILTQKMVTNSDDDKDRISAHILQYVVPGTKQGSTKEEQDTVQNVPDDDSDFEQVDLPVLGDSVQTSCGIL